MPNEIVKFKSPGFLSKKYGDSSFTKLILRVPNQNKKKICLS